MTRLTSMVHSNQAPTRISRSGVAQAIKVHGQGTVLWSELAEAGMSRTLKVLALCIPDAKVKLLSFNSLGNVYPEETVTFHPQGATMTGVPGDHIRRINITSNPSNNLPTPHTYKYGVSEVWAQQLLILNTLTGVWLTQDTHPVEVVVRQ